MNSFQIRNNIAVFFNKSKSTTFSKVDELISILKKRGDGIFETFRSVLNVENSDLSELLAEGSGENMHLLIRKCLHAKLGCFIAIIFT